MTQTRDQGQVVQRKLIHNMEKVSQAMIDYVMSTNNEQELIALIQSVGNEYKKPLDSYVWWPIYALFQFRARGAEVSELVSTVSQTNSTRLMLVAIARFLETGGWTKMTSANPTLMYEIVARLPDYKLSDPDPRVSLTLEEIRELSVLFKAKAASIINAVKGDFTTKESVARELSEMPTRDIREAGHQLPAGSLYKHKPLREVKKLDDAKFGALRKDLEGLLQCRRLPTFFGDQEVVRQAVRQNIEALQAEAQKESATTEQVFAYEHPYAETNVLAPPPSAPPAPHAPVPSAKLSAGAFAAEQEHYKHGNDTYVAPPRKQLTADQVSAVSLFFARKVDDSAKQENNDVVRKSLA
tara:strand:- start:69 stop:1130 length:1062 start_codon:yes stop_codon:yes gene_type:complete